MGFFFDAMSIVGREYEISKDKCKIMFDAACKSVCRHIFTMVRIFAAGSFDPDACSPIGGNIFLGRDRCGGWLYICGSAG